MKKMKVFLFVLVVVSMILTACGGAPASPAANEPAKQEGQAEPASGEKVELVYWSFWNETESSALVEKEWIEDFEALHPNITIKVVWNGRENQTKLRTALGSGTKVDIMTQDADQVAGGMMAEGLGYPLDEFINQTALDEEVPMKDVFLPGVLDQHKLDGHYYLWNYIYNPVMFWYNKAMFEKAGVQPPNTWDEFLTALQKIKDSGAVPIAAESDGDDYNMFYFTYLVERAKGSGFLLKTMEDKTGEMWKDPVYSDAIVKLRELWDKGYIPKETEGYIWPQGQQTLATEESAMELCGGWLAKELTDSGTTDPNFQWGGFRFPSLSDGAGSQDDLHAWLIAFMILKDSEHPKEAFEFLKFIMTKENMAKMADQTQTGVTRKDVQWAKAIEDGQKAASEAKVTFMHVDGGTALHPEFTKNVLYVNFKQAFFGKISPEEFTQKMAADAANYWKDHQK